MQLLRGQIKQKNTKKNTLSLSGSQVLKKIGGLGVSPRLQSLLWVG